MRVFSGLSLTEGLREAIRTGWEEMDARMRTQVRAVAPQNWHLTLYFYGEIDEEMLSRICDAYDCVYASLSAVRVTLGEWGAFPATRSARVIWAGLREGAEKVCETKRRLDGAHREARIPWDQKAFRPHITVARAKNKPVRLTVKELPAETGILDRIGIFRSTLTPAGSVYEWLREYKLGIGGAVDGQESKVGSI
jgi:2'-5' RNA ligase